MKRRVAFILLLLGGAIVNVAVAWGCTLWSHGDEFGGSIDYPDEVPASIKHVVPSEWLESQMPVAFVMMSYRESSSVGQVSHQFGVMQAIAGVDKLGPDRIVHLQHAGWPCSSLQCTALLDHQMFAWPGRTTVLPEQWIGAIASPEGLQPRDAEWFMFPVYERRLPAIPLWPGFAVNTLFYAGILWLLFAAPFALRRRRRIKRGLCPKCAYPIGASDVCTECGAAVPLSHPGEGQG